MRNKKTKNTDALSNKENFATIQKIEQPFY